MPAKDRTKQNQYQRTWYLRHKEQRVQEVADRRQATRDWIHSLKTKCSKCSETDPVCLDFHHRDPDRKEVAIASTIKLGWSRERIYQEIEKCEILCAKLSQKGTYCIIVSSSKIAFQAIRSSANLECSTIEAMV